MSARAKLFMWLIILGVVDIIVPLPVLAVAGVYIVARRPAWFRKLITDLYRDRLPGSG